MPAHTDLSGVFGPGPRSGAHHCQPPRAGLELLCNGVVIFEDTGELLPGGGFIAPHRPTDLAAFDRPAGVAPGHLV